MDVARLINYVMRRSVLACLVFVLVAASCAADPAAQQVLGSETVPGAITTTSAVVDTTIEEPAEDQAEAPTTTELGSEESEPAPAESAGTPTELSTDPAVIYRPDTCFEPPSPGELAEKLDCDEPHTVEVYAVRELAGGPRAAFLGLDSAIELCNEDFMEITGVGIGLATVFRRSVLRPSEETWATGERAVTCFVVFPELTTERLLDLSPVRAFGKVSLYGMEAGDCFSDFNDSDTTFTAVACTEPHDAEVFVDFELDGGPFPGDAAIEETADDLCFGERFNEFVGVEYGSSSLSSLRSRPSEETWAEGDRTINCVLTDGVSHSESFEGSEL